MEIFRIVAALVEQAAKTGLIEKEDGIYCRNRLLALLGKNEFPDGVTALEGEEIPELLDRIVDYAVGQGLVEDLSDLKAVFAATVMDVFLPRPSELTREFYRRYDRSPREATDFFYRFSCAANNVQVRQIARNVCYQTPTEYGLLDITINLSKPEKNPKDIAAAKLQKSTNYPKCLLCAENEGYAGRIGHPARASHRMIRLSLCGEPWLFQYSPYGYYNEHCIVLSDTHRDMAISRAAFDRLLRFVEWLPHYFLGSNADLPIVGGSILTHDHYQGGRYEFAMAKAPAEREFTMKEHPAVSCAVVRWPMSVIRLSGEDRDAVAAAAEHIWREWKTYDDPSAEILSHTGDTPHNTVTPIARMRNGKFEMDIVLRNNRQTEEFPMGIFHPHPDVQHIKQENIGLIEVMGLAVLPARLVGELAEVEKFLLGEENAIRDIHLPWAQEMKARFAGEITPENVRELVRAQVGEKFKRVLEDAGVFKRDEAGRAAFARFTETL